MVPVDENPIPIQVVTLLKYKRVNIMCVCKVAAVFVNETISRTRNWSIYVPYTG